MANEKVKGFKVFNPDWTCTPDSNFKQYTCPGTFEEDVDVKICNRGMHFCKNLVDCFQYKRFDPENKVAEVIAHGEIDEKDNKCCTNKLEIVREIPWPEVLERVNQGKGCTGFCNTGDRNTGDCNTGDRNTGSCNTNNRNTGNRNTGNRNTGDYNTGDYNTGDYNTGDWNTNDCNTGNRNTGNCNTGNRNTGNCNTGNCNTGDWNYSSFNTGCFNTSEHKILMFDEPSDWTYQNWLNSEAHWILRRMPKDVTIWVYACDMTDEEKAAHPEYVTTGGYLKKLDERNVAQDYWSILSEDQKQVILSLPNFDKEKFYQCTGIRVDGDIDA